MKRQTLKTDIFLNSEWFKLSSVFCASDQFLFYLAIYFNLELTPIYVLLCRTLFYWHIVSEWKKDEKSSAKTLTYFWLQFPFHKIIPPDEEDMIKRHLCNILGSELVLMLKNSPHMFYFPYWPKMCFVLMRFRNHDFTLCLKARGWIQSILCLFACQCH